MGKNVSPIGQLPFFFFWRSLVWPAMAAPMTTAELKQFWE